MKKTLLQLLDEYGHQQLNENYGLNPKSRNYKYKAKMDIAASNQNLAEDREAERALDGANANDTYMTNNQSMYVKQADGSTKEEFVGSSVPEDVFQQVHQQNLDATILKSQGESSLRNIKEKQAKGEALTQEEQYQLDYLDPSSQLEKLKEKQDNGEQLTDEEKLQQEMIQSQMLKPDMSNVVPDYMTSSGQNQLEAVQALQDINTVVGKQAGSIGAYESFKNQTEELVSKGLAVANEGSSDIIKDKQNIAYEYGKGLWGDHVKDMITQAAISDPGLKVPDDKYGKTLAPINTAEWWDAMKSSMVSSVGYLMNAVSKTADLDPKGWFSDTGVRMQKYSDRIVGYNDQDMEKGSANLQKFIGYMNGKDNGGNWYNLAEAIYQGGPQMMAGSAPAIAAAIGAGMIGGPMAIAALAMTSGYAVAATEMKKMNKLAGVDENGDFVGGTEQAMKIVSLNMADQGLQYFGDVLLLGTGGITLKGIKETGFKAFSNITGNELKDASLKSTVNGTIKQFKTMVGDGTREVEPVVKRSIASATLKTMLGALVYPTLTVGGVVAKGTITEGIPEAIDSLTDDVVNEWYGPNGNPDKSLSTIIDEHKDQLEEAGLWGAIMGITVGGVVKTPKIAHDFSKFAANKSFELSVKGASKVMSPNEWEELKNQHMESTKKYVDLKNNLDEQESKLDSLVQIQKDEDGKVVTNNDGEPIFQDKDGKQMSSEDAFNLLKKNAPKGSKLEEHIKQLIADKDSSNELLAFIGEAEGKKPTDKISKEDITKLEDLVGTNQAGFKKLTELINNAKAKTETTTDENGNEETKVVKDFEPITYGKLNEVLNESTGKDDGQTLKDKIANENNKDITSPENVKSLITNYKASLNFKRTAAKATLEASLPYKVLGVISKKALNAVSKVVPDRLIKALDKFGSKSIKTVNDVYDIIDDAITNYNESAVKGLVEAIKDKKTREELYSFSVNQLEDLKEKIKNNIDDSNSETLKSLSEAIDNVIQSKLAAFATAGYKNVKENVKEKGVVGATTDYATDFGSHIADKLSDIDWNHMTTESYEKVMNFFANKKKLNDSFDEYRSQDNLNDLSNQASEKAKKDYKDILEENNIKVNENQLKRAFNSNNEVSDESSSSLDLASTILDYSSKEKFKKSFENFKQELDKFNKNKDKSTYSSLALAFKAVRNTLSEIQPSNEEFNNLLGEDFNNTVKKQIKLQEKLVTDSSKIDSMSDEEKQTFKQEVEEYQKLTNDINSKMNELVPEYSKEVENLATEYDTLEKDYKDSVVETYDNAEEALINTTKEDDIISEENIEPTVTDKDTKDAKNLTNEC